MPDGPTGPRQREIFLKALDTPTAAERAAFLDGACGGDAALRTAVEALLADHRNDSFLEKPALATPATVRMAHAREEQVGTVIGRYRLLEALGEGGFGTVWLAEQQEPVRRKVALKVIKLGMDTRQVVARFEAERQALAMMDHPNIARVLDAGATDTGRPYFVMELVRGIKITDFCDRNRVPIPQRLDLFIQVCAAIQHAHQKGIIHRDIKPSNILVTDHDGPAAAGCPKVIDFGIAKATEQKLTNCTLITQLTQFLGTPAYMSPEQAGMKSVDIDTRSDIYSLGVLLYELLTGVPPFDPDKLLTVGVDEMRRIIRETEPLAPSKRLTALTNAKVRTQSASSIPAPCGRLPADLDWIAMKCLEKDRARRYATTNDLAADIQRHLNHEPILARPTSPLHRLGKSIQRNRLAYASGVLAMLALLVGLWVAVWGLMREREARQQAESARQEAEAAQRLATAESIRNEQVAKFLMGGWGPSFWHDQDPAFAHRFLDRMSGGVRLALASQPASQGDLWVGIGNSYASINDFPTAITNLQWAVASYQAAFGTGHPRLAQAVAQLARLHRLNQDDMQARTNAEWAVAMARRCNNPETLATCLLDAAKSYSATDRPPPEAIPLLREAMQLRREVVPHLLAFLDSTRQLVKALEGLADQGCKNEAIAILEEELRISPKDGDLRKLRRRLVP